MDTSSSQAAHTEPAGVERMMTPEEAVMHVVQTDSRFALTEAEINGVRYPVFANAPTHLRRLLEQAKAAYADTGGDALVYQDQRWSHEALCQEVRSLANALADDYGIRPGEPVAMAMRNYPELPILILAVASMGAVAVPMNAWWSEEELAYGLKDCGARVVFADGPRHEKIQAFAAKQDLVLIAVREAEGTPHYQDLRDQGNRDQRPDVQIDADDDFAILYSSGSTGHPKGAVLTHRGAISAVYSWLLVLAVAPLVAEPAIPLKDPDQVLPHSFLVVTPLFHVTALHPGFLLGVAAGATVTLMYKWDPQEAVRLIKQERVTRFTGVPTQTTELMQAAQQLGEKLDTLEAIGSGGAKRPAAQVDELVQAFPDTAIASGWGMTETNALGIQIGGPDYTANPEAAGRLTPPLQAMCIVDDDGNEVPTGEVGELLIKSAANMRCYFNMPEETAETLRDGWLYTGDLARVDEDGLTYIVDRKKSIIIRGGENIASLEVEGALHRHPAVVEAVAFPIPDERLGEIVGAAIQLKPDADVDEAELKDFLTTYLAPFKIPDRIWLRYHAFPRGGTDKTDRRALRAECLDSK